MNKQTQDNVSVRLNVPRQELVDLYTTARLLGCNGSPADVYRTLAKAYHHSLEIGWPSLRSALIDQLEQPEYTK